MAKLQTLEDDSHCGHSSTSEFSKKSNIMYCLSCGNECLSDDGLCASCGKNIFLSKKSSEIIGGYIELAKRGRLKKYYGKTVNTKSVVKMNEKRMIHQILIHKHMIKNVKKEIVDKIYNANIIITR